MSDVPAAHLAPAVIKKEATITKAQGSSVVLLLFILVCVSSYFVFKPHTWEYKLVAVSDAEFETQMNTYGSDGWEVVSARRATSDINSPAPATFSYEFIFKRVK